MNLSEQINTKLLLVRELSKLIKLEMQLAGMNVLPLLAAVLLMVPMIIVVWLLLMVFGFYGLSNFAGWTVPSTLVFILVMNCVFLLLLIHTVIKRAQQMVFSETRAFFTTLKEKV